MTTVLNSLILTGNHGFNLSYGFSLIPSNENLGSPSPTFLSLNTTQPRKIQLYTSRRPITVQAAYSGSGRPNSASIFVGGFVLGGIIVGALGCVYAPQISKALAGTDKKDLMRKLPKFIYDEEKALEKTRKVLAEKIAQLNSAIDDVSSQLKPEDSPNAVNSDEVESAL